MNWNIHDDTIDSNPSKRGPGRPRSSDMVHITVRVPREMYDKLMEWGNGKIGKGVRVAVERAMSKGEGE